jgi:hypothetical protein
MAAAASLGNARSAFMKLPKILRADYLLISGSKGASPGVEGALHLTDPMVVMLWMVHYISTDGGSLRPTSSSVRRDR